LLNALSIDWVFGGNQEVSMLNRAISSPTWAPSRLSAGNAALVRRYVLMVIILSTLGCVYLWQVNVITDLRQQTRLMLGQTVELEGANAPLMQQLAQWESPSHIDQAANAAGWQRAETPIYVQVPYTAEAQASDTQVIASTQIIR
jgi:hypothetical protein